MPVNGTCTTVSPPGTPPTTTTTTTVSRITSTSQAAPRAVHQSLPNRIVHAVATRLPSTGAGWSLTVALAAALALLVAGATLLVRQRRS